MTFDLSFNSRTWTNTFGFNPRRVPSYAEIIEEFEGMPYSIEELAQKYPEGIPLRLASELRIYQENRFCDTLVSFEDNRRKRCTEPLCRLELPTHLGGKEKSRNSSNANFNLVEASVSTFHNIVFDLVYHILECAGQHGITINESFEKEYVGDNVMDDAMLLQRTKILCNCFKKMKKNSAEGYSSAGHKFQKRFIGLFFKRGHLFSEAEIQITGVHRKLLLATLCERGLPSNEKLYWWTVVSSLCSPTGLTQEWKAVVTNLERDVFQFIATFDVPPLAEDLVLRRLVREEYYKCLVYVRDKWDHPRISEIRCLAMFVSTREFAQPDNEATLNKFIDYINGITKDGFLEQPELGVTRAQYEEFVESGKPIDDILSTLIANEIRLEHQMMNKSRALNGQREPINQLSGSSDLESTRKEKGHYHSVIELVLPFLRDKVSDHFNVIYTEIEDIEYVCTDFGIPICTTDNMHLPIWRVAFLAEPISDEREYLSEMYTEGGIRAGIDKRFGTFLHLYGIAKSRVWFDAKEAYEAAHNSDVQSATSEMIRQFVDETGHTFPKERCVPVLEPGGKVRWVSCSEFALLLFQQPVGDLLRELYSGVSGCRVGLQEDHHLFRFEQSFADHTLHKVICAEASDLAITVKEVARVARIANGEEAHAAASAEVTNALQEEGGLLAYLYVRSAEALSQSYGVAPWSALLSTDPPDEIKNQIIRFCDLREGCWVATEGDLTYDELAGVMLADPEIRQGLILCCTADQISATDTINQLLGRRGLIGVVDSLEITHPL